MMENDTDEVAERTHLIAARARRLLYECDQAEWGLYCVPGCPHCAVELAREQLDEERGWATTEESRATSEAAMRCAADLVEGAGIQERCSPGW